MTGHSPRAAWMSVWHRPLASMRTSTSPGPGVGTDRSRSSSGASNAVTTAAVVVAGSGSAPDAWDGTGRFSTVVMGSCFPRAPTGAAWDPPCRR